MLSVDHLPRPVMIYGRSVVQIQFLNLEASVATLENGDLFLRNLVPSNENMFLLFMGSNTTAVMTTSNIFLFV